MYSVDPRALPSDLAYETGTQARRRAARAQDELPETVGIVVWGTAAMRTAGDDAGEILALLGVRPRWHPETRRITGLESIPLEELGRPRIDVTVRISGFFRDAFPHLVDLLDDAVTLVAGLDEPLEHELRPQARARRRRGARGRLAAPRPRASSAGARARTAPASCSSWTSATGATTPTWPRSTRPGAATPTAAGSTACEARSAMRRQFARIDVAVKNIDTREHDLLDSQRLLRRARRDDRLRPPPRRRRPARGDRRLVRPVRARRAVAGRGGAAGVPLARREPALDRLDDAPRLQGRVRALARPSTTCSATTPPPASSRTGCTSR